MTDKPDINEQPKINRIGFDNLLEDIFGLNIRALKTIAVLFKSPVKYFHAALTPEWENKYTPSFRVWFGIMAILVALNFIYNNDHSSMTGFYEGLIEQLRLGYVEGYNSAHADHEHPPIEFTFDKNTAAKDAIKWVMVYFPFAYIPIMALAGLLIRFWGTSLTYVTRLRYLFAVVVPSTTFMFLSTFLVLVVSNNAFTWLMSFVMIFILGLDFLTAYRGPFKAMPKAKRIWRSFALMIMLSIIYFMGSLIATVPALIKALNDNIVKTETSHVEPSADTPPEPPASEDTVNEVPLPVEPS